MQSCDQHSNDKSKRPMEKGPYPLSNAEVTPRGDKFIITMQTKQGEQHRYEADYLAILKFAARMTQAYREYNRKDEG